MRIPKSVWVIAFWVFIIAGLLAYQNQKLTTGKEIWVKPIPVDPMDLFRGEYVQFQYDFSTFQKLKLKAGDTAELNNTDMQLEKIDTVYAVLREEENYNVLDYYSLHKPAPDKVFLKGRALGGLYDGSRIIYNIESYFVPQGEGKVIEQSVGKELLALIHVNEKGEAFLKKTNIDSLIKEK